MKVIGQISREDLKKIQSALEQTPPLENPVFVYSRDTEKAKIYSLLIPCHGLPYMLLCDFFKYDVNRSAIAIYVTQDGTLNTRYEIPTSHSLQVLKRAITRVIGGKYRSKFHEFIKTN